MPFTPLHLGPGAIFKVAGGRHFSFMVFGGAQVLMDIEPLLGILQSKAILHGYTHTLLGALIIGAIAGIIGKPISLLVLKRLEIPHYPFSWSASFLGAYVGTFSHVLLDAIMHGDMSPWWPLAADNQLFGFISYEQLHVSCVLLGIIASAVIAYRFKTQGRA